MLKLDHITAGYEKIPVIRDISLEFGKGGITSIIGPNGSGKSTLLKAITGLCEVRQGTVYLKGRNRTEIGGREFAKQVFYLPQSHTAGAITVGRMVLHGRFPYIGYPKHYGKADYEYCRKAMERTGILPLQDKRVDELSGGQRQKVYLAMALSGEAELFLFDEPATYLDIRHQLELLRLLQELKEEGKTVITVLHDLDFAMQISGSLVIMNQGRIAICGTADEIQRSCAIEEVFRIKVGSFLDHEGRKRFYFGQLDQPGI